MMLADVHDPATALFPVRVPEPTEAMTPEESASLVAWQETPTGSAIYSALAAHVASRVPVRSGRLLSVAEGQGLLAARLARRLPGVSVVGTDVCPEVVARAQADHLPKAGDNLSYEVASTYDLGKLGKFDAVVCLFSFHHFFEPELALAQMIGVLRPGGWLYLMDLRRDASAGSYFRRLDDYVQVALPVARLFRNSVQAAHTVAELRSLLGEHRSQLLDVGRIDWGDGAWEAYRREDRLGYEIARVEVPGLWLDAVLQVPEQK